MTSRIHLMTALRAAKHAISDDAPAHEKDEAYRLVSAALSSLEAEANASMKRKQLRVKAKKAERLKIKIEASK